MLAEQYCRTVMLVGEDAVRRLMRARVAVFGVGGVGSYAVEALARAGVGSFLLVDNDIVAESNLNRQLHATHRTIGQYKTQVMAERIREINPAAGIETREVFCLPENIPQILAGEYDYLLDAVDTVSAKVAIVEEGFRRGIPVISAMGAGNKLDPTRFQVADIYATSVCPLCRVMRRELKKRHIPTLKVVYSTEPPLTPLQEELSSCSYPRRQTPGSISFVPSAAGLILAGEVVRDLMGIHL